MEETSLSRKLTPLLGVMGSSQDGFYPQSEMNYRQNREHMYAAINILDEGIKQLGL